MRNLKKFLALVLAMVMAFSLMVTAHAENPKTDYPDMGSVLEEFEEAVDVLSGMGVFRGNNGEFLPQNKIMRCEAVAILYRLVTHDVDDTQVALYAPLATYFNDVKATDWFAPYVGFAVDAGYIKGYNGNFNPYSNVTGYEMLAMLLRAAGYGKNGEFTGALWQINVGSQAEYLGVLSNIQSTHYADTLSQPSAREVVADLTFQVATKVNTVTWSAALGYNKYSGAATSGLPGYLNPTLGEREFGLTPYEGVIVGNQATGESKTLLGWGATGTTSTGAVKDPYGYDIKWYVDEKNTDDDGSDDTIKFVYRFTDNDPAKDPDPNYDKSTITNTDGDTVKINVYTGSTASAVGNDYGYEYALAFTYDTGLDLFGHMAKVWYDSRTTGYKTYALLDEATLTAYVYAEDAVLSEADATNDVTKAKLGQAAIDAGFSVQRDTSKANASKAHFSDRYSQISAGTANNGTANISPISTYALISNSGKSVDVVIALSAEVGYVEEKNTTAVTPYLTLGNDYAAVSTFTNDSTETDRIYLSNLTSDTKEEQKQTGALVTAYQIVGTKFDLDSALTITGNDWGKVKYQLNPMTSKDITVATFLAGGSTINGVTDTVTSVTPTTGDALRLSGITKGDKIISWALPIATGTTGQTATKGAVGANLVPQVSVTYHAYTDLVGRFISLTPVNDYKFIYGTYAGYELNGFNAGTGKYNLVGVDLDAKEQVENPLNSIGYSPINGTNYASLAVTKLDQGFSTGNASDVQLGNEIRAGVDTGYMYNSATGDLQTDVSSVVQAMGDTTWSFDSGDATNGFKRVNTGTSSLLFTNDTEFIIVTGTGTATLKVETAKGITGLLAGGTSADIKHSTYAGSGAVKGTDNMVYYQTDTDLFGTVHTDGNEVVLRVILADGNLTRWNAQTLYFNFNGTTSTGAQLPLLATTGRNIEQYALWNNGKLDYYFIDLDVSTKVPVAGVAATWTAATDIEGQTFYTLSKIEDVNGIPVYKAVALANPDKVDYTSGHNSKSTGANPVIYDYITVNNLSTALLKKDTAPNNELVYSISPDVVVCDVQWKTDAAGTIRNARSEITNIRELNNAVSVMNTAASAAIYDDVEVAVVYEGSVITTIYVIDATV